jgi:hypothetical protein
MAPLLAELGSSPPEVTQLLVTWARMSQKGPGCAEWLLQGTWGGQSPGLALNLAQSCGQLICALAYLGDRRLAAVAGWGRLTHPRLCELCDLGWGVQLPGHSKEGPRKPCSRVGDPGGGAGG